MYPSLLCLGLSVSERLFQLLFMDRVYRKCEQRAEQRKNKMTYAERREFEALSAEIDSLNSEKAALEAIFNGGTAIDDIAAKSARYDEVKNLLDEKELRWLELSEKE